MQVITSHDHPPIPVRGEDWSAWIDGTEEDGVYGYGATELAAAIDLLHMLVDVECDLPTFIAGLEKVLELEGSTLDGLAKYGYRRAMRTVMGFV